MIFQIKTLPIGISTFHLETDASQIDLLDYEDAKFLNPIEIEIELDKRSNREVYLKGVVKTDVKLQCSRCTEEYDYNIRADFALYYMQTSENYDAEITDEEIATFAFSGYELDITDRIRETLILEVPIRGLCKEDCKGLCPICGANLNYEKCDCHNEKIDPRWGALAKLKGTL